MKQARTVVGVILIVGVAIAFYMLALSPKKQEASELSTQIDTTRAQVAQSQSEIAAGSTAKTQFSKDYEQLVLLGKAVPQGDDTASMMVQLSKISSDADVSFDSLTAGDAGGDAAATAATASSTPGAEVPPTEVAASLLPIGATVGSAGLATMPYALSFKGRFFHVADFLKGLNNLVSTGIDQSNQASQVSVNGRLLTIDGFTLIADPSLGFPDLKANFSVTSYVTPPDSGITAGATPTAPAATTTDAGATPTTTTPDPTAAPAAAVTGLPR